DLLAAVTLRDELDDLLLARREWILPHRQIPAGTIQERLDQRRHRSGIQELLASKGGPASLDQVAIGDGLDYVAGRAGLERLVQVALVLVHREHQDPQL